MKVYVKHDEPSRADARADSRAAIHTEIRVDALGDEYVDAAVGYAQLLGLPCSGDTAYALQVGAQGLQFVELGPQAAGPVRVDFVAGAVAHRRQFGGGAGQMIARAVGLQPGIRPIVLDATAGLGRDAFVLAELGCPVTMIERQPLIAALLEDGLRRASLDAEVAPIVARMCLLRGNAIDMLHAWLECGELSEMSEMSNSGERLGGLPPQVIYLDPMFPHRDKSALVKKEMRLFRPLAGDDDDAPTLLAAALRLATHRVVVKRPRKAPAIAGVAPGYVLEGKSSRYDIYPRKALRAKP